MCTPVVVADGAGGALFTDVNQQISDKSVVYKKVVPVDILLSLLFER